MENPKQQLIERLKTANNILVTVSSDPSVDQLSAAIGLTLMLNKMGKHGTAVFSGKVPSTMEFLQPEKTLEKNTDSLRDFIIALDKSKADKLRYKVEDNHVKIFITPYRTSITDKDLDFSQGDFNVEVVVALGVNEQRDLDKAITAHGRILHDATTVSVTNGTPTNLGSINWDEPNVSSLCEMIASLANDLQSNILDGQIATALMTGVVAQTHRFSNEKTSPSTMSISAALMAAGANQQLVASKLEEASKPLEVEQVEGEPDNEQESETGEPSNPTDGALQINHGKAAEETPDENETESSQEDESTESEPDEQPNREYISEPQDSPDLPQQEPEEPLGSNPLVLHPPMLGGTLTANAKPEGLDPSTDPLSAQPTNSPLLDHQNTPTEEPPELPAPSMDLPSDLPPPVSSEPPSVPDPVAGAVPPADEPPEQTLTQLEEVVQGNYQQVPAPQFPAPGPVPMEPPVPQPPQFPAPAPAMEPPAAPTSSRPIIPQNDPAAHLGDARDAVSSALSESSSQPLPPIMALNAQPLEAPPAPAAPDTSSGVELFGANGQSEHIDQPNQPFTMPDNLVPSAGPMVDDTAASVQDPTAPPTVPPPFMPNMPDFDNTPPPQEPNQNNPQQPPAAPGNPFNLPPS